MHSSFSKMKLISAIKEELVEHLYHVKAAKQVDPGSHTGCKNARYPTMLLYKQSDEIANFTMNRTDGQISWDASNSPKCW